MPRSAAVPCEGGGGTERLVAGSVGQTVRGGGVVLLRADKGEKAQFKVDAQRASALEFVISSRSGGP